MLKTATSIKFKNLLRRFAVTAAILVLGAAVSDLCTGQDQGAWNSLPKDVQSKLRQAMSATQEGGAVNLYSTRHSLDRLNAHYQLLNEYGSLEKPGLFQVHFHLARSEYNRVASNFRDLETINDPFLGVDIEYVFRHLEHCRSLDPDSKKLWLLKGTVARVAGLKEPAFESYKKLYELDPCYFHYLHEENKQRGLDTENKKLLVEAEKRLIEIHDTAMNDSGRIWLLENAWATLGRLTDDPAVAIEHLQPIVRHRSSSRSLSRFRDALNRLYVKKSRLVNEGASQLDWLEKARRSKVAHADVIEILNRNDEHRARALKILDPSKYESPSRASLVSVQARQLLATQAEEAGDYDKALVWLPNIKNPRWQGEEQHRTLNRICRAHRKATNGKRDKPIRAIERFFSGEQSEFENRSRMKKAEAPEVAPPKPDPNLMLTYGLLLVDAQRYIEAIEAIQYALSREELLDGNTDKREAQQSLSKCTEQIQLRLDLYRQQLKNLEGK